MIRLFLFLLFLTCLGVAASWVADSPGSVTIHWLDYRIDTSFAFLLLLALLAAGLLAVMYLAINALLAAPRRMAERRRLTHYQSGLSELTYGVAALAASDIEGAQAHTRKAEKLLGRTPLTLLLSAQIARSRSDDDATRLLLEQMLAHPETEYLAARSLSDAASRRQLFPKALALAERAQAVNPKEQASLAAVIGLHIRLGQWQEAMQAIDRAMRKGRLSRSAIRHYKGVAHTRHGMQLLDSGRAEEALAYARAALKELPDFPPAALFAANTFAAQGQRGKAITLLLHAWKKDPHPPLADALRTLSAGEKKEAQLKLMRKLAALQPVSPESSLALAQAALQHREWKLAREALTQALQREESARACRLMAELEQRESGNNEAAARWLTRAAHAIPDPAWICGACAHPMVQWSAHCGHCGAFDSLEWKKRDAVL